MDISFDGFELGNDRTLTIIGGLNVLESAQQAVDIAGRFRDTCNGLGLNYIFKASFDKANRSSIKSYRGPGIDEGLKMLAEVRSVLAVPVLTDIHAPEQAAPVAQVADVLQLPAFLCRQTDLVTAMAVTGKPINIKKAQFLAADEMHHIVAKFREAGNDKVMLCERGTSFGYHNLVVDFLGFPTMKALDVPLVFDVTHALQLPGARSDSAGGRRALTLGLARAGVAQGIAGLFMETHPQPDKALCDGPCALPLDVLPGFLEQIKALDTLVKQQPDLDIR
ncbi:MAG: 3-deoxy-8-phosphooctulonate synthase [Gammaproteobacteria bacterium]|nr:3-deoxy-8-phosphooctulonate synthase [Gammaproteobacteria bacterium]